MTQDVNASRLQRLVRCSERPILFSGPMVRAILAGRKTQTRRIVKARASQPGRCITLPCLLSNVAEWRLQDGRWFGIDGYDTLVYSDCPYGQVGDRLWVRETFRVETDGCRQWLEYAADDAMAEIPDEHKHEWPHSRAVEFGTPWSGIWNRPSIHMPRWASRITLEVTGVSVERLNEITLADCAAEGAPPTHPDGGVWDSQETFIQLWESINGAGSWKANPWVWVVEFQRQA